MDYARLMAHWQRVFPQRIYDVSYEAVVGNQMSHSRELIDRLNLPWNDACLRFFATQRPVQTASQWQVRQPIYTHSIGRWKSFTPWLEPLQRGLTGWVSDQRLVTLRETRARSVLLHRFSGAQVVASPVFEFHGRQWFAEQISLNLVAGIVTQER